MARVSWSLPTIFQQVFGYQSEALVELEEQPIAKASSKLGSPFYGIADTGREYFLPVTLGGVELPFPVLRLQARKKLIETEMVEVGASAIEYIGIDNYFISIRGLILGNGRNFPEDKVQELRDLFVRNEPLSLRNAVTDIFLITKERKGFDYVVIKDFDFPPAPGVKNVRGYEINMISHTPFSLIEE